ncbi:MAG: type II secretion system protein GspM [Bacillota bacterium]|nr:type II secretion system protein GspM [Bacillota bacterium]
MNLPRLREWWNRLTKREQGLILFLGFAAISLGYHYILSPSLISYQKKAAELEAARSELSQLQSLANRLDREMQLTASAKKRTADLRKIFAADITDGGAVVNLGLTAAANKVVITGFHPSPVKQHKYYLEFPVQIEMRGPYHGILDFLESLENRKTIPNLVQIEKLTLNTPEEAGSPPSSGQPPAPPGTQNIEGKILLVFYSEPSPAGKLDLGEVAGWKTGRSEPFEPAPAVSPFPGMAPPPSSTHTPAPSAMSPQGAPVPPAPPASPLSYFNPYSVSNLELPGTP